ncbi:MAG: glycosyltransferase, partial [Nonomuraea sp.]|nr:glycosyltransferase [Nonomuraea sp.]
MPHVSVVVPIYDVEPYLAACLESLAAQTWRDLEVVMVDDGSPDGSAEIAARFAERDSRFRLFRQRNAGLGAARNAGIARARGELMMFVDSDDLLPLGAVEAMVSTLARTGSDFVTGNVSRFTSLKVYASPMHKAVFAEPELRTHVGRQEILLKDRLVTNKLWRRSFWDEHGLAFPEGVLYEDIPVALPAQFLAKSVDMLAEPVYLWREREGDRPSITQDRAQVKGIEDRLGSIMTVRDFLERTGRVEHLRSWDRMVLESDLTAFFPAFAGADRVFRDRFRELSTQYLDRVSPETLREVAVLRRLRWYLLREGAYDELIEAMDWEGEGKLTGSRRGASFYLDCPVPGLPPEALRLGSRDLDLQQKVDAIGWEDGRLAVQGRVTMRYLRPLKRLHQLAFATLVHDTTGKRIRLRLKKFLADPIGRGKRKTWGGYRFAVDPAALLAEEPGRWYVELGVLHRGMHRKARLAGLSEQVAHEAEAARPAPGVRVTPGRTCSGRFVLDVARETARVSGWRV